MSGTIKLICRVSIVFFVAYFIMRFINLFNIEATAWDFVALFAMILPYVIIYLFLMKIAEVITEVDKIHVDNLRLDTECKRLNAKFERLKTLLAKKTSFTESDLNAVKDELDNIDTEEEKN